MTKDNLLVSVIVTVRDRFSWFGECLESVLAQEYEPIQIIIVDDGSLEKVSDFIHSTYGDMVENIEIIRHKISFGVGLAREKGRLQARGEFITYLDSDDIILPTKISKQVRYLEAHPEFDMSFCDAKVFSKMPLRGDEEYYRKVDLDTNDFLPQLLKERPWGTGACLWTRRATDLIGPWSDFRSGEDQEYEFRAGLLGLKFARLPEALFYVRRSQEDSQLNQNKTLAHQEDARMYISLAALAEKEGGLEPITLYYLMRRMVSSLIFLLSSGNRKVAVDALFALKELNKKDFVLSVFFQTLLFFVFLFHASVSYRFLDKFRYHIFILLQKRVARGMDV